LMVLALYPAKNFQIVKICVFNNVGSQKLTKYLEASFLAGFR
jgi:hypothetical protein